MMIFRKTLFALGALIASYAVSPAEQGISFDLNQTITSATTSDLAPLYRLQQYAQAAPAAPATQNTITTTAPVTSETKISVGTIAGDILTWVMVAFSGPIGGIVVWILVRVLKKLGIDATDALRARLTDIVVNGLNVGAAAVEARMKGQGQIEIKNEVVKEAVSYAQSHASETIKALGLDPQSGEAVAAIKARIETAISDPTVPTPAVLDPVIPNPTK